MRLVNSDTGDLVVDGRDTVIEEILTEDENKDLSNNYATYIETKDTPAGLYQLQMMVPKSSFAKTKRFGTCLNFDLSLEYV